MKDDENGFTLIDLNKDGDPNDQFIFTSQSKQVFYVNDPNSGRWSVVITMKPKLYDSGVICDNIKKTLLFSRGLPECDDIDNEDVAYVCEDCEGVYVKEDTIIGKKRKKGHSQHLRYENLGLCFVFYKYKTKWDLVTNQNLMFVFV